MLPPFGHQRDAVPDDISKREAGERLAAEGDRCRRPAATMPAIAESSEVLPAPFGPTMATTSPASTCEIDAVHGGDGAVADDEAGDSTEARGACRRSLQRRADPR